MGVLMQPVVTPELVSGPAAEPVTTAEAKEWLRQDVSADDTLIAAMIRGAREWFEVACDRAFVEATWRVRLPWFSTRLELPYPPLREVLSVTYRDADGTTQTLAASTYDVVTWSTPGYLQLADAANWPITDTHPEAVTVTYRAGPTPAQVPEMVKSGVKMLACFWYENRGDLADRSAADRPVPAAVERMAWAACSMRFG